MRRGRHERLFALLFLLFVVGVGFSVYYQNQAFFDHAEEMVRMTGERDFEEAEVVMKPIDDRQSAPVEMDDLGDIEDIGERSDGDFFIDSRLRRERVRSRQIALLQEIIENQQTGEDIKNRAQETLIQLTENIELENEVENFIQAKGFEDCLIFLSGDRVDVVVKTADLNENRVEKIGEAVSRKTDVDPADITVIGREN